MFLDVGAFTQDSRIVENQNLPKLQKLTRGFLLTNFQWDAQLFQKNRGGLRAKHPV